MNQRMISDVFSSKESGNLLLFEESLCLLLLPLPLRLQCLHSCLLIFSFFSFNQCLSSPLQIPPQPEFKNIISSQLQPQSVDFSQEEDGFQCT